MSDISAFDIAIHLRTASYRLRQEPNISRETIATTLNRLADSLVYHGIEWSLPPLTKRQYELLSFLESRIKDNGFAPTFEEIAEHFGYASLATIHEHLTNLENKGYIRRHYNLSRGIEVVRCAVMPKETAA